MTLRTDVWLPAALRREIAKHLPPALGWTIRPFGPDGASAANSRSRTSVIVTRANHADGVEYVHASIAHPDRLPTYAELVRLHRIAFGNGYAYQVFAPSRAHVNIHDYALHLWGRRDGAPAMPDFGAGGSI